MVMHNIQLKCPKCGQYWARPEYSFIGLPTYAEQWWYIDKDGFRLEECPNCKVIELKLSPTYQGDQYQTTTDGAMK
jgi:phage FluMu protein Com